MAPYQKLAKWLLVILGTVAVVAGYYLFSFLAGLLLFAAVAGSSSHVFWFPLLLTLPVILAYVLYRKKQYSISAVLSVSFLVCFIFLILFVNSISDEAAKIEYVRTRTHVWNEDLTIGRIVEDCGRSPSQGFAQGLGGTALQNACYYQFAVEKKDSVVCESVEDFSLLRECIEEIKAKK